MDTSLVLGWENYYVILGTSAGGLTGLTFVVIALVKERNPAIRSTGISVFVTPTIVHFGGVLAFAAFMNMPHPHLPTLSAVFVLAGTAGVVYSAVIAAHMPRIGSVYTAVLEDWIWNVILPIIIYTALVAAGFLIWRSQAAALYGVAALSLALLFVGIHNAWDIAVYMTLHPPDGTG